MESDKKKAVCQTDKKNQNKETTSIVGDCNIYNWQYVLNHWVYKLEKPFTEFWRMMSSKSCHKHVTPGGWTLLQMSMRQFIPGMKQLSCGSNYWWLGFNISLTLWPFRNRASSWGKKIPLEILENQDSINHCNPQGI